MPSTVNNPSGLDADHQEREVSSTVINNSTCGTNYDPEKNTNEELTLYRLSRMYSSTSRRRSIPQVAARTTNESFEEKQRDLKNEMGKYSIRNVEGVW